MAGSAETSEGASQASAPNEAGEGQQQESERKIEFLGPAPKEKKGPDVSDAVAAARKRMAEGKPFAEPTPPGSDDEHAEEEGNAAQAAGESEIGEGEHAQWRPGDPSGTYRDEKGRMRWAETTDDHKAGDFASAESRQEEEAVVEQEEAGVQAEQEAGKETAGEREEEEEEGDDIVVALPGRAPEDPEIEFVVQNKESADALRRLKNMAMRGEELNRQLEGVERQRTDIQADREELETIMAEVAADPAGFIMKEVRTPEIAKTVVFSLLANADDDTFKAVLDEITEWEHDPRARETAKYRSEHERRERRDEATRSLVRKRDARANAVRLRESIESLMPDNMDAEKRQRFLRYAGRDLRDYVNQNRIERLDPAQVPALLEQLGTLQLFGLKPTPRVDRAKNNGNSSSAARAESAAADGEAVERARAEGDRVRRAVARRKDAASSAGPGAGAAATRTRPPKGAGVKEAIDFMKKQMGRG